MRRREGADKQRIRASIEMHHIASAAAWQVLRREMTLSIGIRNVQTRYTWWTGA